MELKAKLRTFKERPEGERPGLWYSTGLQAIDGALGGGVAAGEITEFSGQGSCGRTALAMSLAALVTRQSLGANEAHAEKRVAWIDTEGRLDVVSMKAAGVEERNFLWMRGSGKDALKQSFKAVDLLLDTRGFALIVLDLVCSSWRKGAGRSSWWVRIARKLKGKNIALLVLAREATVFQPACRLVYKARRLFTDSICFRVMRRGAGDVQWICPAHLNRPFR